MCGKIVNFGKKIKAKGNPKIFLLSSSFLPAATLLPTSTSPATDLSPSTHPPFEGSRCHSTTHVADCAIRPPQGSRTLLFANPHVVAAAAPPPISVVHPSASRLQSFVVRASRSI